MSPRELLAGLLVGGLVVTAGRPASVDTMPLYVPSGVSAAADTWTWHAPEAGGRLKQLGFSSAATGPGPNGATAVLQLRASAVPACTITIPCDGTPGQHAHEDCSAEVEAGAELTVRALSTNCTGGAVPSGLLTLSFLWR